MAIKGASLPSGKGKWSDVGGNWTDCTPLEMLGHLNEWCKGGCKTIYRRLLVEDKPEKRKK